MTERENRFEALIYSDNRDTVLRCCRAFAEIPLNWMTLDDADLASDYLAREHFDFVLLDLDSSNGPSILRGMKPERAQGVVLVISGASIDPAILEICYQSQYFYPVRPNEIESHLNRAVQLVERSMSQTETQVRVQPSLNEKQKDLLQNMSFEHSPGLRRNKGLSVPRVVGLGNKLGNALRSFFTMRHALSVTAQERVASGIAALGAIWFVSVVTTNFTDIASIGPPPSGPLELIGLSVLLWLCAKHRRVTVRSTETVRVS